MLALSIASHGCHVSDLILTMEGITAEMAASGVTRRRVFSSLQIAADILQAGPRPRVTAKNREIHWPLIHQA